MIRMLSVCASILALPLTIPAPWHGRPVIFGAPAEIRTPDLVLRRHTL